MLIKNILEHYKILSSKQQEKFLNRIQQINLCSKNGKNYMQAIIKQEPEIVEKIFEILERRGDELNLEAEKHYDKKTSVITLTPNNSATMDELLVQKEMLLLPEEDFYRQCHQIANKPKKTEITLTSKTAARYKQKPDEVYFPLLGTFSHQTPNSPSYGALFVKEKVPQPQLQPQIQTQTQPKKPAEVVDLTEEENSSEFSSRLLNGTFYEASDLEVMEIMQTSLKRKAPEVSQGDKVQKTSEDSQYQNLSNVDEAQEFIDSIFSDQFNFQF